MAWEQMEKGVCRIVTGSRDRVVGVLDFDSQALLHAVFTVQLDSTVPKSLGFARNTKKDIIVFGLYDGQM